MAKLYFRYGAMNSGKSTSMLQAAYNYEERGHQVLLAKPAIDTKGDIGILSRLGVTRRVDFLLTPDADAYALFQELRTRVRAETGRDVSALLLDEAQFLTRPRSTTFCASRFWRMFLYSPTASAPTFKPSPFRAVGACSRSRTASKSSKPSAGAGRRRCSTAERLTASLSSTVIRSPSMASKLPMSRCAARVICKKAAVC